MNKAQTVYSFIFALIFVVLTVVKVPFRVEVDHRDGNSWAGKTEYTLYRAIGFDARDYAIELNQVVRFDSCMVIVDKTRLLINLSTLTVVYAVFFFASQDQKKGVVV